MEHSEPQSVDPKLLARRIVAGLGGTADAARFFGIKPPSVSGWLKSGVPAARIRHLRDVRPDLFGMPSQAANDEQGRSAA